MPSLSIFRELPPCPLLKVKLPENGGPKQFADLGGILARKGVVFLRGGGWVVDTPMQIMSLVLRFNKEGGVFELVEAIITIFDNH